jgi:hypothetical protein
LIRDLSSTASQGRQYCVKPNREICCGLSVIAPRPQCSSSSSRFLQAGSVMSMEFLLFYKTLMLKLLYGTHLAFVVLFYSGTPCTLLSRLPTQTSPLEQLPENARPNPASNAPQAEQHNAQVPQHCQENGSLNTRWSQAYKETCLQDLGGCKSKCFIPTTENDQVSWLPSFEVILLTFEIGIPVMEMLHLRSSNLLLLLKGTHRRK